MAALIGKDGFFSATTSTAGSSTPVGSIDSWSLNPVVGTADITAYGSSWEAHKPTIKGYTVSASGTVDRANTYQAQLMDQLEDGTLADVYLRLYISESAVGDQYWSGHAIMEGWTVDSAVKDRVSVSYSFKGNGALSYTTTLNT